MGGPRVIVADDPTPGLDLELARRALSDLRSFADAGNGVLLITHDIELALGVADRIAVFNDGSVVEETAVANFASPDLLRHPFTRALWHALPEHDFAASAPTSTGGQQAAGGWRAAGGRRTPSDAVLGVEQAAGEPEDGQQAPGDAEPSVEQAAGEPEDGQQAPGDAVLGVEQAAGEPERGRGQEGEG
jgi:ABC-type glutathione transport system ATPase component